MHCTILLVIDPTGTPVTTNWLYESIHCKKLNKSNICTTCYAIHWKIPIHFSQIHKNNFQCTVMAICEKDFYAYMWIF